MKEMKLERTIQLDDAWDVIVAGGGPAGCTAATAAAREGARTLLIEATGALGGMGTSGLVPAWCPFSDGEKIIYGGLAEKVFTTCRQGIRHADKKRMDWSPIDPELLKRIYDDLVTEAGASVLFSTRLAAVETKDGGVEALVVSNKSGLVAYKARTYVDCTGDADVVAWAGAPFEKGDEKGELQPATHCFVLGNVDSYGYLHGGAPYAARIRKARETGKYPLIRDDFICNNLIGPDTVGFNAGHIWDVDNTDPMAVSRALITGRKMAVQFQAILEECSPKTFGGSFVAATGSLIGSRETRRIVGDYVLTVEDFLARRSFPDEICRNAYPIDVHTAKAEIETSNRGELEVMRRYENYRKGESHGIPYRCLIPQALRNVLVAGRCISTDRLVQGSTRVMPVCLAMGEAAGMAAGMAAAVGGDVRAVNTDRLRARLREEGAYLP